MVRVSAAALSMPNVRYGRLKGRMVRAISGGMDGEIPAEAIEKEHGAFKNFKG